MAGRTRLVALEAREREEATAKLTLWGGPDDAHRRCALFAAAPHPNPFPIVRRVQRGEERARLLGQALKSAAGHSRRFARIRATSGYPPKLTVKANQQALSPGAAAPRRRINFQIREETLSEAVHLRGQGYARPFPVHQIAAVLLQRPGRLTRPSRVHRQAAGRDYAAPLQLNGNC